MAASTNTFRQPQGGWYGRNIEELCAELASDPHAGLSEPEAKARLALYGENRLQEKKRKSLILLFGRQMNNILVFILIAAAVISALLGEISDALVIAAVILLNAVVGVIQESKAEQALAELKKLSTPRAVVRRDGALREIPSEKVVPGDIVVLETGRVVPCDLRLIQSVNLRIEESALTGESVPVEKIDGVLLSDEDAPKDMHGSGFSSKEQPLEGVLKEEIPLGDRKNMAFMSTIVTYGRGTGITVATGMSTQIGKIAAMLEGGEDEHTPLQKKLERFARILGFIVLGLCGIMFGIAAGRLYSLGGVVPREQFFQLFLTAVSLAVAAIPEGLPAIITIVLALGVQRMIRRNAIVRRLPAVETLGSVSVICTDKTGTLTQNRMTVRECYAEGKRTALSGIDIQNPVYRMLLEIITLCNDAGYSPEASAGDPADHPQGVPPADLTDHPKAHRVVDQAYHRVGDPTEIALLESSFGFGITKEDLSSRMPRVDELPFDSERKLMTTVHRDSRDTFRVASKGAVHVLADLCTHLYTSEGLVPFTRTLKENVLKAADRMSEDALRVLGAAFKIVGQDSYTKEDVEKELVFCGFVGMIDPPRLEVKGSIERCNEAGVRTVMITGDHRNTAFAIARELGIASEPSAMIDGSGLDELSQEELDSRVDRLRVFARVSPEHKVRIVRALKKAGHIVSMTGDGVNDAPSLRAADIGVAMGKSGTDVAKGAADMVLTDDNFETIVAAVEEGRNIFRNIKKVIVFLLSSNSGEFISVFTALLLGWPPLLLPIHILWVNLVTDTLPALSLGIDPGDSDVLKEQPRRPGESLFAQGAGWNILANGLLIGCITLGAFSLGLLLHEGSLLHARTIAFAVLGLSQLFHAFNLRHSYKSIFQVGVLSNGYLIGSFFLCGLLQLLVITLPPMASVFKVVPLQPNEWGLVIGISVLPIACNEIAKIFFRMKRH